MQAAALGNPDRRFSIADTLIVLVVWLDLNNWKEEVAYFPCVRVVALAHVICLPRALQGLIHELNHTNVTELVVLMDVLGHPLDPFKRPVILRVLVEPGTGGVL